RRRQLSRVVSRTGPESAWLSEILEVSKIAGAVRSLGGSNPSPSADNPNRQQRCGNKQDRGGPQARLSHRLKPLRTAMDCRATAAHRRRDPSKGEECVRLASSGARWSTRTEAAPTRAQL